MGIVYLTTNKINGKKYIGVDTKNKKYYFGSGTAIKLALKKYGSENFTKDIIENSDDNQYLFEKEKYWIDYYDAVNSHDFYNISIGGKGGNMLISEESIRKHKEGYKKGVEKTAKQRKGKTYEEIYGDKSGEEKEKRRLSGLGKKYSQERIKKAAFGLKGNIPWNKGLTKETDIRVKKNSENINRQKYFNIYELTTPSSDKITFLGKKELNNYIKEINKNLKRNNKINIDILINCNQYNDYHLKIRKLDN